MIRQQYLVYDIDGCLDTFDLEIESATNYTNLDYCKGDLNDGNRYWSFKWIIF